MFRRRVMFAAVAFPGFGLVGCGSDDSVDADDPLVGAIADQILVEEQGDETGGVFGGDSATAECFAAEIVGAIGKDRLNEVGFTTDTVPAELQADWTVDEIDILVDGLDGCVDIEPITKTALLADVSEQDQNCILGEIGNDFFLTVVRAGFESGPDEAASQAAIERAYAPLIAAYDTCGVAVRRSCPIGGAGLARSGGVRLLRRSRRQRPSSDVCAHRA